MLDLFPESKLSSSRLCLRLARDLKRSTKGDCLKFSDGSSKLLSGHKFQDKYVALFAEKLLLYRDIKVSLFLLYALAATLACKCGESMND